LVANDVSFQRQSKSVIRFDYKHEMQIFDRTRNVVSGKSVKDITQCACILHIVGLVVIVSRIIRFNYDTIANV